jgi:ferric-dicitrate binding protein FerR (iron transport regulator)
MPIKWFFAGCCALLASLPCFGADVGTLTLIDGKVRMLRGTAWYNVVEGVRIREGDVVDAPEKSQFQVELTDGGALSLIGPGALYVVAATPGDAKSRPLDEFWVSRGWLKFDTKAPGSRLRIRSGSGTVTVGEGAAVVRIGGDTFEVFVESGAARVADGPGGEIKAGGVYRGVAPRFHGSAAAAGGALRDPPRTGART